MYNNCPFCGGSDAKIYAERQQSRIQGQEPRDFFQCTNCHTIYPRPRITLSEILSEYVVSQSGTIEWGDPTAPLTADDRFPLSKFNFVRRVLNRQIRQRELKTALDIGTGNGRFCHVLGTLGIDVVGLEPNPKAVVVARKYGLDVQQGFFPESIPPEIAQRTFDLITIKEVVYYFSDIMAAFERVRTLLSPKGIVFMIAHQGGSHYYDTGESLFSRYGETVQSVPTIDTLNQWLNSTGFSVVEMLPYPDDYYALEFPSIARTSPRILTRIFNALYSLTPLARIRWIGKVDRVIIVAKKT